MCLSALSRSNWAVGNKLTDFGVKQVPMGQQLALSHAAWAGVNAAAVILG